MRVREIRPHVDGCNALAMVERGDWKNPLFMSTRQEPECRDKIGRLNRHGRLWLALICNSTSCHGRWVVPVDDIEQAVFEACEGGRDAGS